MIIQTFDLADNYRPNTAYLPCDKWGTLKPEIDTIVTKDGRFIGERTGKVISENNAINYVSGYYMIQEEK